jgi:glycosyltransferase involved in cell wall biosynthesis
VTFDISVILNCQSQGRLIHATVKSIEAAIVNAEAAGLSVEWIIVANKPTEGMVKYLKTHKPERARFVELELQGCELARNQSIQIATGQYLALVDGEHLWSSNWLSLASQFVTQFKRRCIAHSELKIFFDKEKFYARNVDQESSEFCLHSMFGHNYWNNSSFALREIYIEHPFVRSAQEPLASADDWHWNCQTVAAGLLHKVVPGTIHALRMQTSTDLLPPTTANHNLLPGSLFRLEHQALSV